MARFPDSHADITVQLLKSVKSLLGENALNLLIGDREAIVYQKYNKALTGAETLDQKLKILSQKRSEEGYMAEWKKNMILIILRKTIVQSVLPQQNAKVFVDRNLIISGSCLILNII